MSLLILYPVYLCTQLRERERECELVLLLVVIGSFCWPLLCQFLLGTIFLPSSRLFFLIIFFYLLYRVFHLLSSNVCIIIAIFFSRNNIDHILWIVSFKSHRNYIDSRNLSYVEWHLCHAIYCHLQKSLCLRYVAEICQLATRFLVKWKWRKRMFRKLMATHSELVCNMSEAKFHWATLFILILSRRSNINLYQFMFYQLFIKQDVYIILPCTCVFNVYSFGICFLFSAGFVKFWNCCGFHIYFHRRLEIESPNWTVRNTHTITTPRIWNAWILIAVK